MNIVQLVRGACASFAEMRKYDGWEGGGEDFSARFSKIVDKDSHLYIVSNGGAEGVSWMKEMREWLRRGCRIYYVYTGNSIEPVGNICFLEAQFPKQVAIHMLSRAKEHTNARQFAKKHYLRHPTVHVHPTKPAVWLERYHEPHNILAFNVEYVAPPEAGTDSRYLTSLEEIRKVIRGKHYLVPNPH